MVVEELVDECHNLPRRLHLLSGGLRVARGERLGPVALEADADLDDPFCRKFEWRPR